MFWHSQRHVAQLPLRNGSVCKHVGAVHQPTRWFCLLCNRYRLQQDFFSRMRQAGRGLTQCHSGCGMMYLCLTITPVIELKCTLAKEAQTSLQLDLMHSKSSTFLPPRAFVLHFQCNYMLNICLSICWIPAICMTRFSAGLAKPNGMTAMPSNHRPSAAGRVCPALLGAGEGEDRRKPNATNELLHWTPSLKEETAIVLVVDSWWKIREGIPLCAHYLAQTDTHSLCCGWFASRCKTG